MMTKHYKRLFKLFSLLSFCACVLPIAVYAAIALANGEIKMESKLVLGIAMITGLLLLMLNTITKYHLRSPLFIMLAGLYFCFPKGMMILIAAIGIGVILDEFVFYPLKKRFREKYVINKEIDKRGM